MVCKLNFLVHISYSILILNNIQLHVFTHSTFIMDTLIIGDSIIKYQQKEFVHGDVLVKPFPGYNMMYLLNVHLVFVHLHVCYASREG